jgi:hypothetical protein
LRDKRPIFGIHHVVTISIGSRVKARLPTLYAKRCLDDGEIATVDNAVTIEIAGKTALSVHCDLDSVQYPGVRHGDCGRAIALDSY